MNFFLQDKSAYEAFKTQPSDTFARCDKVHFAKVMAAWVLINQSMSIYWHHCNPKVKLSPVKCVGQSATIILQQRRCVWIYFTVSRKFQYILWKCSSLAAKMCFLFACLLGDAGSLKDGATAMLGVWLWCATEGQFVAAKAVVSNGSEQSAS